MTASGLARQCTTRRLYPRDRTSTDLRLMSQSGHVWTVPAVQEESDVSAKRSGHRPPHQFQTFPAAACAVGSPTTADMT
jgi:hypothetical protein